MGSRTAKSSSLGSGGRRGRWGLKEAHLRRRGVEATVEKSATMVVEAGTAPALVTAVARTDVPSVNGHRPRGGTST